MECAKTGEKDLTIFFFFFRFVKEKRNPTKLPPPPNSFHLLAFTLNNRRFVFVKNFGTPFSLFYFSLYKLLFRYLQISIRQRAIPVRQKKAFKREFKCLIADECVA
jgi:hypothetical protein